MGSRNMDAEKHLKVLVIDDEPESIDLVRLILHRGRGDEVIGAVGGHAGIAKAQEVMPDFIILDLNMPDVDGYEVYPQLKALPGLQSIPILFTGEVTTNNFYPIAQSLGAAGYVQVPYGPQELVAARDAALSGNVYYPSPEQLAVAPVGIPLIIFGILFGILLIIVAIVGLIVGIVALVFYAAGAIGETVFRTGLIVAIVGVVLYGLVKAWDRLRKALRLPWRGR